MAPSHMTRKSIRQLCDFYRGALLNDVIPFWLKHTVDDVYGGITTSVDRKGHVVDTDKLTWQQARWSWMLAELYNNVEARDEWLQPAMQAAEFIRQHAIDPDDGRMWFHLTQDGRPIRKRRYAFSESFAAIAFGELAQATGDSNYADLARKCFTRFVNHDPGDSSVGSKFTSERKLRAIGIPMITIATCQELRDSIGLDVADKWIDRSIYTIQQFHLKPDINCVMEQVNADGTISDHFDGRTLNPGHAIEAAWFIMREGKYRSDKSLIQMGCDMLDWMWERGWDAEHGGLLYFVDVYNKPVQEYWHDMKFWWPQCEVIIATLLAHAITGDSSYLARHEIALSWFQSHFADQEFGEYFGYCHRDGTRSSELKGNHWKGPFHIPRMLLTCWQITQNLQGTEN